MVYVDVIVASGTQQRGGGILGRQRGRDAIERPGDGQRRVVPADRELGSWAVVVGGLVEKVSAVARDQEAMGQPSRNPQLPVVGAAQLNTDPLAVGGAARAHVDRYIEHAALRHAHQLALRMRGVLSMQSTQHATR